MWLRKLLFGEKREAAWTKVLEILDFVNVDISKLKADVDMINAKLRIPGLKKKAQEQEQENPPEEKEELPNDGFDGVRQLRKDLNMNVG